MKLEDVCFVAEKLWQTYTVCLKAKISLCQQTSYSQSYGLSSSHVWLWELDHKEGRAAKNWLFWTVVLKKTLKSPLDSKEIKPVDHKEKSTLNAQWKENYEAEAEAPMLWSTDANSELIGRDSDTGKDWRQKKKVIEDEMVGWHHQCSGHELEQTAGDGEGQGSLVCCSSWGHEESDMTWQLNNNSNSSTYFSA